MLKVGLIGCGNIGSVLAGFIDRGDVKVRLVCVFDSDYGRAKKLVSKLKNKPQITQEFNDFLDKGMDLVVEAASQGAVKEYAEKVLNSRRDLMIMSVGALVDMKLMEKIERCATKNKRNVYLPSGAICGLDGVKSASIGKIYEVKLSTRKPPKALEGVRYVIDKKIDLKSIRTPKLIYEGKAEEAAKLFPKNINVCATLSLASIGPKKTIVQIIADPGIKRNIHEIYVKGEFGELITKTINIPSPKNPKTSYLACLSAARALKQISERVYVGI